MISLKVHQLRIPVTLEKQILLINLGVSVDEAIWESEKNSKKIGKIFIHLLIKAVSTEIHVSYQNSYIYACVIPHPNLEKKTNKQTIYRPFRAFQISGIDPYPKMSWCNWVVALWNWTLNEFVLQVPKCQRR